MRQFVFRHLEEPVYSDEIWYDLTDGGYVKPEMVLAGGDTEQLREIKQAIETVRSFIKQAIDAGVLEMT